MRSQSFPNSELEAFVGAVIASQFTPCSAFKANQKTIGASKDQNLEQFVHIKHKQSQLSISTPEQVDERMDTLERLVREEKLDPRCLDLPLHRSCYGRLHAKANYKDLEHILKFSSSINAKQVERIAAQLIYAVYQLHKNNLVHRDIDLSNVLVYEKHGQFDIALSDFDETSSTGDHINILRELDGKVILDRIPPELKQANNWLNFNNYDQKKLDAYALGDTLIQFLEGVLVDVWDTLEDVCDITLHSKSHPNLAIIIEIITNLKPTGKKEGPKITLEDAYNKLTERNPNYFNDMLPPKSTKEDPVVFLKTPAQKRLYRATKELHTSSRSLGEEEVQAYSSGAHNAAILVQREAQNTTPPNTALIDSVQRIRVKNDYLKPFRNIKEKDELIDIVLRAKADYMIQNKFKQGQTTRYWCFFNAFKKVGVENADELYVNINKGNMTFTEAKTIIDKHIQNGRGQNTATSFKTILQKELDRYTFDMSPLSLVSPSRV